MINGYEILRRTESRQPRATRIALSSTSERQVQHLRGNVAHAVVNKTHSNIAERLLQASA